MDEGTLLILGMIDGEEIEGLPLGVEVFEDVIKLGILEVEGTDEDEGTSVVLGIVEDEVTEEVVFLHMAYT